jgi:hypothetical protein
MPERQGKNDERSHAANRNEWSMWDEVDAFFQGFVYEQYDIMVNVLIWI